MTEEGELTLEEKIQAWVSFYKVPLIFTLLAFFLLGVAAFFWQSSNPSDEISFSQEASGSGKIKADIEGAVLKPGVYELESGSRIGDLLIMAGGLTVEADREWVSKTLNLAAKLTDGGKVYIPSVGEVGSVKVESGKGSGTVGGAITSLLISINSASLSELDKLPGVGPVTAQKIIDGRPYQTIEELVSRKIVGQSVFEKIKEQISPY